MAKADETAKVEVDTSELDVALDKAKTLQAMVDQLMGDNGAAFMAIGRMLREAQNEVHDARMAAMPRSLDERIVAVQAAMPELPQDGHAEIKKNGVLQYEYDFITEGALMKALRPLLAEHGIAAYYSDDLIAFEGGMATVRVSLTLAANGEERMLQATAHGTDYGDKAASKAKTTAVRYLLAKTFLQGGLDPDPENENVDADEAAAAATTREHRAERKASPAKETDDEKARSRRARLRQRINQLTTELDEVQGHPAGHWMGELPEFVQREYGVPMDDLTEQELVEIGESLVAHISDQQALAEKLGAQGPPTDPLVLKGRSS